MGLSVPEYCQWSHQFCLQLSEMWNKWIKVNIRWNSMWKTKTGIILSEKMLNSKNRSFYGHFRHAEQFELHSKFPTFLSFSNSSAPSVQTYMCGVVVLTGSWPTSGSNANVFSFQQRVDHIIQKGHLDHRRIHILGLQHLNTHVKFNSYSLQQGLKNSRTHKLVLQKQIYGLKGEDLFQSFIHTKCGVVRGEKKPTGLRWGIQQSPLIMGGCSNHKV